MNYISTSFNWGDKITTKNKMIPFKSIKAAKSLSNNLLFFIKMLVYRINFEKLI